MKSFEIQAFGIDNLKVVEKEPRRPGVREVLVRMAAASLNYRDYLVVKGDYNPKMKLPRVPLSDGAGVVEEIGPDVTRVKKGDRVAGCFMQTWIEGPPTPEKGASALGGAIDGVLSEYVVFHEDGLVQSPPSLTDEEAAALPCAGVTAWHALFEHSSFAPGDSVLLQGTGGVSTLALLFARRAGLRILLTSSSDQKIGVAREMGADETINYKKTPDWDKEARKLTDGLGVDHVVDVGGNDTMPRSLKAVRTGGVISSIGILAGKEPSISAGQFLMNSVRVQGIYVGSRAMFERMNCAIEFHKLKPAIDKVFPWTDYKEALRYMEGQSHFGKICLKF